MSCLSTLAGGTSIPGLDRGCLLPDGGTPSSPGQGVLQGTPCPGQDGGTPLSRTGWGTPLSGLDGVPLCQGLNGVSPPPNPRLDGVPSSPPPPSKTGWGTLIPPPPIKRQSSMASTCYAVSGMALAFTQEDFLVMLGNVCPHLGGGLYPISRMGGQNPPSMDRRYPHPALVWGYLPLSRDGSFFPPLPHTPHAEMEVRCRLPPYWAGNGYPPPPPLSCTVCLVQMMTQ